MPTEPTSLSRRQFVIQLLAILYMVILGLLIYGLYPYTAGATTDAIPWNWNPALVCYALWFLDLNQA